MTGDLSIVYLIVAEQERQLAKRTWGWEVEQALAAEAPIRPSFLSRASKIFGAARLSRGQRIATA